MLNKCDLVEEDWLELVKEEIKEELEGTFLEQAPIVEVSAATGQGIPELIEVIERLTAEEVVEKDVCRLTVYSACQDLERSLPGHCLRERFQKRIICRYIRLEKNVRYEIFKCMGRM